jgi:cation-transporting ATPase 13A3/4/5
MAPEHKALLVEGFKKEQLAVLMCGDGANDCMALRTANIGVSLSEEEASIAAPFTSKNQNISCLVPLLKEGKSSLVTSIQTFKYMMMYSLVQFLCVTMLMVLNSYLSENQFLSVDIFIIIPLAFFIPATGPYKLLTKHHPTDSLISYPVIASILSQTIIAFVFQLAAHYILVYMLEDYENICQPDDDDTDILACPDNTSVFLISNMQYLITAFAFSISKPFKSPIYTNYYLTFFMIFAFVYSCFIIVFPNKLSVDLLQLYNFDDPENSYKDDRRDDIDDEDLYIYKDTQIKYYIQGLALLNFIISYIFEKVIIPATTAIWNARKIRQLRDIKRIQSEQALTMQQLFQISE